MSKKITDKQIQELMTRRNLPATDPKRISREQMQRFLERGNERFEEQYKRLSDYLFKASKSLKRYATNGMVNSEFSLWFQSKFQTLLGLTLQVAGDDPSKFSQASKAYVLAVIFLTAEEYDRAVRQLAAADRLDDGLSRTTAFLMEALGSSMSRSHAVLNEASRQFLETM